MNRFWGSSTATKIKICGVTDIGFAFDCYELGIDALGFHVWNRDFKTDEWKDKSDLFSKITEQLPSDIGRFLLIDFCDVAKVSAIMERCRFDTLQIHKYFPKEEHDLLINKIKGVYSALRVVTVVSMNKTEYNGHPLELANERSINSDAILLDSSWRGGTGEIHDWQEVKAITDNIKIPCIVAGGINCHNINKVVETVKPFAVDIESGANRIIVDNKGQKIKLKSVLKVEDIIKAIRCNDELHQVH